MQRILQLYGLSRGPATVALLCVLVAVAAEGIQPLLYREIFDGAIPTGDSAYFFTIAAGLVAVFVTNWTAMLIRSRVVARLASGAARTLRGGMLDRLQQRALADVVRTPTGDVLARFSADVAAVENVLLVHAPRLLHNTLTTVLCSVLLFVVHWKLALLTCALLPLSGVGAGMLGGKVRQRSAERREEDGALSEMLREMLTMQPVLRAFSLVRHWRQRFDRRSDAVFESARRTGAATTDVEVVTIIGIQIVVLGVICGSAWFAFQGEMTSGTLVGFIALLVSLSLAVEGVGREGALVLGATGPMARVDELLAEPERKRSTGTAEVPALQDSLQLVNVDFSYGVELVLRGVNLHIDKGQSVGIVGPSGSGKSTVLRLLVGFDQPTKGQLTWDGADTADADVDALRQHIGVVFQDAALFDETIRENIRFGRLDATDEAIERAAREAEVHDIIQSFPDGYDTMVGEGGGRLSGGQRQRIAIARALVRDPDVLLLDEATAALDPSTEAAVNATLARVGANKTVVAVTHRLAPLVDYDRVVVLREGEVVESGSHTDLIAACGLYHELHQRQAGLHVVADGRSAEVSASLLRGVPLFAPLTDDELAALAPRFVAEHFGAGTDLLRQGEPGSTFHVIAHGQLDVLVDGVGTTQLRDGDYFGEIALLGDEIRTATLRARSDVLALSLTREDFAELIASRIELQDALRRVAAQRLEGRTG